MSESDDQQPPPLREYKPREAQSEPASAPPLPEHPSLGQMMEAILRNPFQLVEALANQRRPQIIRYLFLASIFCLAIFGLFVGTFSMGEQLYAAPLKIVAGVIIATLLCLPSLYIFANLSGLPVNLRVVSGMLLCAICLMSLLLLGFAPIVWLFSQSTDELSFVGPMNLLVWLIALWFGVGLIYRGARLFGAQNAGYLKVWVVMFILVLMQMSTSLRPIIGTSETQLTTEKVFFVQHWLESFDGQR